MPDASPARIQPPPKRRPPYRNLRVYAFDPSLSWRLDTAGINQMTLRGPWGGGAAGPRGEDLGGGDGGPASNCCYAPGDLHDPHLPAESGPDPHEGDPQFHPPMG